MRWRTYAKHAALAACLVATSAAHAQVEPGFCPAQWSKAFDGAAAWDEFRTYFEKNYAYVDRAPTRALLDALAQDARATRTNAELSTVLQRLLPHYRDSHLQIIPSPPPVRAWAPSASDIWVELKGTRVIVADVKGDSIAARRGLRPGAEIIAIDGMPMAAAIDRFDGIKGHPLAPLHREYAANMRLTGSLGTPRRLSVRTGGTVRDIDLPPGYDSNATRSPGFLSVRTMTLAQAGTVIVLRPNNSLGETALVAEFDAAIAGLGTSGAIVLDLRDTPGGGVTTTARAIMGHFIDSERPYQRLDNGLERSVFGVPRISVDLVQPRAPRTRLRVAVLVGRWTGSMGEGLAIGMKATAGATIIGAPMADLLGDLNGRDFKQSCLRIEFAWNRAVTIDGVSREDVVPDRLLAVADTGIDGGDPGLAAALAWAAEISGPK